MTNLLNHLLPSCDVFCLSAFLISFSFLITYVFIYPPLFLSHLAVFLLVLLLFLVVEEALVVIVVVLVLDFFLTLLLPFLSISQCSHKLVLSVSNSVAGSCVSQLLMGSCDLMGS